MPRFTHQGLQDQSWLVSTTGPLHCTQWDILLSTFFTYFLGSFRISKVPISFCLCARASFTSHTESGDSPVHLRGSLGCWHVATLVLVIVAGAWSEVMLNHPMTCHVPQVSELRNWVCYRKCCALDPANKFLHSQSVTCYEQSTASCLHLPALIIFACLTDKMANLEPLDRIDEKENYIKGDGET